MSDIYVFSSNDNTNDYTTMGLVGALTPTECTFKETANGESIVELTHPIDAFGRYTALQRGNILAVPVPVRTTPEIRDGQCVTTVWTYKVKPLNQLTSTAQRTLYMWRFSSAPKVAVLNPGEEITVIYKANEEEPASGEEDIHPWKAKSKRGEGWIDPDALELVTTHSIEDDPAAIEEIQSPWTVTKQYFRIYETKKSLDEINVTARHISYDLLYNMTRYRMGYEASLQDILDGVLGNCYAEHQFSAYTTLDATQTGNWYDLRNPIDVFLNADDGLCARFGVDLIRDNYNLYFLKNPGINRGVRIQYGKNMTGVDFTSSEDEVATRIVPVGEKEDGTKLYLDDEIAFPGVLKYNSRGNTVKELQRRLVQLGYSVGSTGVDGIFEWRTENGLNAFKADANLPQDGIYDEATHEALMEALGISSQPYIDSEHINDYPIIHVYELKCENCTVGTQEDGGGKVTEEIARARMRQQVEDLLESGCDLPKIEMSVEFVNLGDTEEYKQFRNLENCFLYDYVIVQHPTMDIDVTAQIMEIEWDCLLDRMVSVEIGSVGKTLANTGITSWQIPNGFSGLKIAGGTVPGGALQSDIISARHLQAESINTEALQAACVTAVKIAAGAIQANHISVEAIDAVLANIDTAVIEKAEIDWAEIASLAAEIANIAKAQITEANINQANINWANIANLSAAVAQIARAEIDDAVITSAQIDDLAAVVAEIVHAEVGVGEFSLADIQNLLANALILESGSAGSMTIKNLIVTQANMLGAVIKKLVIPGTDGKYYEIVVGTDGSLSTKEVTVTEGEIEAGEMNDGRQIVASSINADNINGSNITAQQAILNNILTQALTAKQITAGEALIASATIPALYTTSIEAIGNSLTFSANQKIQLIVSNVEDAQDAIGGLDTRVTQAETAITQTQEEIELRATKAEVEAAQDTADFATPYISDTPPEDAPEAGKMWVDTGVNPEVWRRWRGADVPTEREYNCNIFGSGKNLLPPQPTQTVAGVTYTPQGDGTYIANGTCTGASTFELLPACILPPGTYTLSGGNGGISLILAVYDAQGGWLENLATSRNGAAAVVQIEALSGNEAYHRVIFQGTAGTTMNNVVLSPQLEAGDTATVYEPYQDVPFLALDNGAGQIQSVAVGAGCRAKQETRTNLFDPSAITSIPGSGSGVTLSYAADGGIQIAGTTGDGYAVFGNAVPAAQYVKLPEGALTASIDAPAGVHMLFRLLKDGTTVEGGDLSTNSQITRDIAGLDYDSVSIGVQVAPNTTVNATVHPMLNAGAQALPFEAYKTVLPITGRESVGVRACGTNLYNTGALSNAFGTLNGITAALAADGGVRLTGTASGYAVFWRYIPAAQYILPRAGQLAARIDAPDGVLMLFRLVKNGQTVTGGDLTTGNTAASADITGLDYDGVNIGIQVNPGISIDANAYPMLNIGAGAMPYTPYAAMGGGTIGLASPLYGLPDAEDIAEMGVDGEVLVTRRTAVKTLDGTEEWSDGFSITSTGGLHFTACAIGDIRGVSSNDIAPTMLCSHYSVVRGNAAWASAVPVITQTVSDNGGRAIRIMTDADSLEDWRAYLAAQYAAGTPVTVVYELAAPETEALTAVTAITPVKGQISIITDADALSASIAGSGWETVNDTTDVRMALADVDTDLEALVAELGLLDGQVGQIAEQIITPDEIKNIVVEMDEYKAMATTVSQTASDLEFARTQIAEVDGRVLTIEEYVRISGSNVDIGRSDSKTQLHLDNEGWDILEDGRANISARDNKVSAPRMDVSEALMMGGMVFRSGGGHLRLQKR